MQQSLELIMMLKQMVKRNSTLTNYLRCFYISITKGKIREIYHWLSASHLFRNWRIKRFLNKEGRKFLQIGGGKHLKLADEWLNGDIIYGQIYLNARKKLPFPDESLDVIFTEQFFEHLPQEDGLKFLAEVYRVLKPGGILRQATPDLEKLISIYRDQNEYVSLTEVVTRHIRNHRKNVFYAQPTGCQFLNDIFRLWGHQFIYDKRTLQVITEEAGFRKFRWAVFGESEVSYLRELERHADEEWMKNAFTIIYEAEK